jgi:hypothetical protein
MLLSMINQGAASMTPWIEAIDDQTEKLFYVHRRSNAVSLVLPKGALLDSLGSFKRYEPGPE